MTRQFRGEIRWIRSLLAAALLGAASGASADFVAVKPAAVGYVSDGGSAGGNVIDGSFDKTYVTSQVQVTKWRSMDFKQSMELRGIYEFTLPSVLLQPGAVLESAVLSLKHLSSSGDMYTYFRLYGYSGDGVLDVLDAYNTGTQLLTASRNQSH